MTLTFLNRNTEERRSQRKQRREFNTKNHSNVPACVTSPTTVRSVNGVHEEVGALKPKISSRNGEDRGSLRKRRKEFNTKNHSAAPSCVVSTTTVSSTFVTKTPEHLRKKETTKRPKLTRQKGKTELVQKALFDCPLKVSDFKNGKSTERRKMRRSARKEDLRCETDDVFTSATSAEKKLRTKLNFKIYNENLPSSTPIRKCTRRRSDTDALPPLKLKSKKRCFEESDDVDERKPKLTQAEMESRQSYIFQERLTNVLVDRFMSEISEVLDDFQFDDLRAKAHIISLAILRHNSAPSATFNRIYQNIKRKSNKFLFSAIVAQTIELDRLPSMTAVELDPKGAASRVVPSQQIIEDASSCRRGKYISGQLVYLADL